MIERVVSGGQTGADRAGVDAAIELDVAYGGWLPKGRKAQDGKVPEKYTKMREMSSGGYPKRTEQNVIDSDGTVIFSYGELGGGSALTDKFARKHERPVLYVDLDHRNNHAVTICKWIFKNNIKILNVAGSSKKKHPWIYGKVKKIVSTLLKIDKKIEMKKNAKK